MNGRIADIVVWTLIVAALCAITFSFFVVNGLPPKDYLVLFGLIAIGVVVAFIVAIKHS